MKPKNLTNLPIMVALLVGLFSMQALSVVDIHARGIGIVDVGHLGTKAAVGDIAAAERPTIFTRFLERMTFMATAEDGFIAEDLLVPAAGIKALQQRAADLVAAMKDRQATLAKKDLTAEARAEANADVATLVAKAEENATLLKQAEAMAAYEKALPSMANPDGAEKPKGTLEIGADALDKASKAPGFFGRQLQAVRKAALVLKGGDEVVTAEDRQLLKMMAGPTGMNTDIGSEGGFLVASERSNTILQRAYEQGEILSRVNRMPIGAGSNGMTIPAIDESSRADNSRFGGIVSGWLGQGNALSAGKPKFRIMDLKLRKVGAFVYGTDEQLQDAVALEGWINKNLPLELTFRTEDAVINGVGGNQPQGVMNSGAVLTVTRNTTNRITSEDLRGMVNRMWAPLWGRAAFFVDQSTLGEFDQLGIAIGTGGVLDPSYKPAGSVPGQKYATYKNIPIIPVEHCAALGTSGDIVLTNLDEYVLIDKGGVEQAVSLHVAFLTDEAVFRFMYRVDGQLSWNAALTPKSGGDTLSCAVKLS